MQDDYLNSSYAWTVEENPDQEDLDALRQRLRAYNRVQADIDRSTSLAIFLRDDRGQMVAGIYGWLWGECLEVDLVWVAEDVRGQGIGTRLMHTMEEAAVARGCRQVVLNTFSFQGPAFYVKLGYQVFGVIDGYPNGYQKVFLKKALG